LIPVSTSCSLSDYPPMRLILGTLWKRLFKNGSSRVPGGHLNNRYPMGPASNRDGLRLGAVFCPGHFALLKTAIRRGFNFSGTTASSTIGCGALNSAELILLAVWNAGRPNASLQPRSFERLGCRTWNENRLERELLTVSKNVRYAPFGCL